MVSCPGGPVTSIETVRELFQPGKTLLAKLSAVLGRYKILDDDKAVSLELGEPTRAASGRSRRRHDIGWAISDKEEQVARDRVAASCVAWGLRPGVGLFPQYNKKKKERQTQLRGT